MNISVIIPYYNESETILLTLRSIESQNHQPNEVLLIDSGSTDNTSDIINKWIKKNEVSIYKNVFYILISKLYYKKTKVYYFS